MHRDIGATEERDEVFELEAQRILDEHAAAVSSTTLLRVLYYLRRDFVRYGKIDPLIQDPAIEDISCDGVGVCWEAQILNTQNAILIIIE